jgi:hypothetical protein
VDPNNKGSLEEPAFRAWLLQPQATQFLNLLRSRSQVAIQQLSPLDCSPETERTFLAMLRGHADIEKWLAHLIETAKKRKDD